MAITKVPNGPLIKKKGPFKGSTLKAGGKIKKAINGTTTTQTTTPPVKKSWNQMSFAERKNEQTRVKATQGREGWGRYMDSTLTADFEKGAIKRGLTVDEYRNKLKKDAKNATDQFKMTPEKCGFGNDKPGCSGSEGANRRRLRREANRKNGGPIKKAKAGAMIKRADGSTSQRGLWDNIRANKGSGKKPTAEMLKQERKIKAKK
jgi:hypothetical protein